jgi:hypothetical protein
MSIAINEYNNPGFINTNTNISGSSTTAATPPIVNVAGALTISGMIESSTPTEHSIAIEPGWTNVYTQPEDATFGSAGISVQTFGDVSPRPAETIVASWTFEQSQFWAVVGSMFTSTPSGGGPGTPGSAPMHNLKRRLAHSARHRMYPLPRR